MCAYRESFHDGEFPGAREFSRTGKITMGDVFLSDRVLLVVQSKDNIGDLMKIFYGGIV